MYTVKNKFTILGYRNYDIIFETNFSLMFLIFIKKALKIFIGCFKIKLQY